MSAVRAKKRAAAKAGISLKNAPTVTSAHARETMLTIGIEAWNMTRGLSDPEAERVIQEALLASGHTMPIETHAGVMIMPDNQFNHMFEIGRCWVDGGCRSFDVDGKLFAAWVASSVPYGSLNREDLKVPHRAFHVRIAGDPLLVGSDGVEYQDIFIAQVETSRKSVCHALVRVVVVGTYAEISFTHKGDLASYLIDGPVRWDGGFLDVMGKGELVYLPDMREKSPMTLPPMDEFEAKSDDRIRESVRRGVLGVLLHMQHTNAWASSRFDAFGKTKSGVGRDGPPKHRKIVMGAPLSLLDARDAVRDWVSSDRGTPPAFQSLVRGHYKRQVVGVSRTGRKIIWIEPYWRGPEGAPILVRPYKVGGAK